MLMRKSFYVPIGDAYCETLELMQEISEYGLDVHHILHCVLNNWLLNGAHLSVEQAVDAVFDRSTEKMMEMGYIEEGGPDEVDNQDGRVVLNVNEWMSVLHGLEYSTEAYVRTLKPLFDVITASDSIYLPVSMEINKLTDHEVLVSLKVKKKDEVLRVPPALLPLLKAKKTSEEDK